MERVNVETRFSARVIASDIANVRALAMHLDDTKADDDDQEGRVALDVPWRPRLLERLADRFSYGYQRLDKEGGVLIARDDKEQAWMLSPVGNYYHDKASGREVFVRNGTGYEFDEEKLIGLYKGENLAQVLGPEGLGMDEELSESILDTHDDILWNAPILAAPSRTYGILHRKGKEAGAGETFYEALEKAQRGANLIFG